MLLSHGYCFGNNDGNYILLFTSHAIVNLKIDVEVKNRFFFR